MTATISVQIDEDLQQKAETLFADLGLTMSAALTMFLRQAVQEQAIPFTFEHLPNQATLDAMREADAIAQDPTTKGYRNLDTMFRDLRDLFGQVDFAPDNDYKAAREGQPLVNPSRENA